MELCRSDGNADDPDAETVTSGRVALIVEAIFVAVTEFSQVFLKSGVASAIEISSKEDLLKGAGTISEPRCLLVG